MQKTAFYNVLGIRLLRMRPETSVVIDNYVRQSNGIYDVHPV